MINWDGETIDPIWNRTKRTLGEEKKRLLDNHLVQKVDAYLEKCCYP